MSVSKARKTVATKSAKKISNRNGGDVVPAFESKSIMKTEKISVPTHSTFTLPNGLKVILVPRRRLPLFQAVLMIKAGALHDPQGLAGCTNFTGAVLDSGAEWKEKKLTKLEIAEAIDSIGGMLSVSVNHARVSIATGGLTKYSDKLLDLLTAISRYPLFPNDELERERQQLLADLIAKRDQPGTIAEDALLRRIYSHHQMGVPADGTAESVSQISREDILRQWKLIGQPNIATFGIAGDFDSKQMKDEIIARFGDWTSETGIPAIEEPAPLGDTAEIVLVEKAGANQASIQMGHHGIPRTNPDYYALAAVEQILFNGMSSRFFKTIRAERGLTYSIHGNFEMGKYAGPLVIGTSTMKERTGYMISSIFEVIEKFLANGPTTKELVDAQMYLTGSYPLRFDTSSSVLSGLLSLDWVGLPATAISEYRQRIASLTKQDILFAVRKHLHPEKMRIAIVGEVSTIEPQLQEIGRRISVVKLSA